MKEFYWNHDKSSLLCEEIVQGSISVFHDLKRSWILEADRKIKETYPEVYERLSEWVGSGPGKEYARVYQFCACNFSTSNGRPDIDEDFNFIPEIVSCPIRHICKRNICNPKPTGNISPREMEVIKLFTRFTEEEIAERLFISPATVHNHVSNIYKKLGFSRANAAKLLIEYYNQNH